MSESLNSSKGTTIGASKWDTRSSDYGSNHDGQAAEIRQSSKVFLGEGRVSMLQSSPWQPKLPRPPEPTSFKLRPNYICLLILAKSGKWRSACNYPQHQGLWTRLWFQT